MHTLYIYNPDLQTILYTQLLQGGTHLAAAYIHNLVLQHAYVPLVFLISLFDSALLK